MLGGVGITRRGRGLCLLRGGRLLVIGRGGGLAGVEELRIDDALRALDRVLRLFLTVVGGLATVVGRGIEVGHGWGAGKAGCAKKTVACRREEEKLREGEDSPDLKLARREKTGDGGGSGTYL